jgi:glycosyltransferase involved in cell wall biosynthesis
MIPRLATSDLGHPLNLQGKYTDFCMGFDSSRDPVVHRRHLDLGALERAEAAFDDHQALVAAGGIFQADSIVVGLDDPFTVVFGGIHHRSPVDTQLTAFGGSQLAFEAAGSKQVDGPLGIGRMVFVAGQFALKVFDDHLPVLAHAEFYVAELAVRAECTRVVQVGADETLLRFQATQIQGAMPEVLFYGSFINLQGPEVIVEAALTMPEVSWTLLGDGPLRQTCLSRSGGMAHIRFEDWVPYEDLQLRIGRASILLGIFGPSPKAGRVIANKVFQALACGRPRVTRDSKAFPTALRNGRPCGISFVPAGDPAALAAAVRELLKKPELLPVRGQQARASYESSFSEDGIRKALVDALRLIGQ